MSNMLAVSVEYYCRFTILFSYPALILLAPPGMVDFRIYIHVKPVFTGWFLSLFFMHIIKLTRATVKSIVY